MRLASVKTGSGNAPLGVWRLKRTVHIERDGEWVDIAPSLLREGIVFPFPFIGEDAHNDQYLALGLDAHDKQIGVYDPTRCGPSPSADQRVELEVVADGPGADTADSEFVMVFNGSDADIDLTGWMVQDTSPLNAFFFPNGSFVRADDYVVVYSSSGRRGVAPDGSTDDRYFYAGTGMRWNNTTTDIAFLFDDAGDDAHRQPTRLVDPGPVRRSVSHVPLLALPAPTLEARSASSRSPALLAGWSGLPYLHPQSR